MKKSSKKKFSITSKEEQHEIEAATKHSRLVTIATKLIRKECKIVKSFECQKIVRKIKVIKGDVKVATTDLPPSSTSSSTNDDNNSKAERKIANLEGKLRFTKEFDLDEAVSVCLTRLGLKQKPRQEVNMDAKECAPDDGGVDDNTSSSITHVSSKKKKNIDTIADSEGECHIDDEKSHYHKKNIQFNFSLIESMLQHKRLISVVKSTNEKINEHRAWLSQREEWLSSSFGDKEDNGTSRSKKRKGGGEIGDNKKTKIKSNKGGVDVLGHDGNSGLFIDSLAGSSRMNVMVENEQEKEEFGNHDFDDHGHDHFPPQNNKKKNRQGQRARKAKAMAIEARKAGHVWDSSLNWRKAKTNVEDRDQGRMENFDGKRGSSNSSSGFNSLKKKVVSASGLDKSKNVKVSDVATMGKDWKEEGNAHPSWAAREAQKSKSSAQFTGTKITFD